MSNRAALISVVLAGTALVAHGVFAQGPPTPPASTQHGTTSHDATPHGTRSHDATHDAIHRQHLAAMTAPGESGQAAFAAIAEVVRLLDADPRTDWSKVDVERLRQHLIDMNDVVLGSTVKQAPIPGGLAMEITGAGRTAEAIRAMVIPHAAELDRLPAYAAKAEPLSGGVRLTVTAKNANDATAVARIRGLGFAGLLTEGAHHGPHHLAMARGEKPGHHHGR